MGLSTSHADKHQNHLSLGWPSGSDAYKLIDSRSEYWSRYLNILGMNEGFCSNC